MRTSPVHDNLSIVADYACLAISTTQLEIPASKNSDASNHLLVTYLKYGLSSKISIIVTVKDEIFMH